MGRLQLADTDSGKSAVSDEEHDWLTELCRAGRAGAESTDSDDDWLKVSIDTGLAESRCE